MITTKTIDLRRVLQWTGPHLAWLLTGSAMLAFLYRDGHITFSIPWLPISVIGTAVAFYVGFKNNQAYDRMWEARKIWGGIVNSSRSWGMMVNGFVGNQFRDEPLPPAALQAIKRRLIYRHIAWLYVLRNQLLAPAPWEHASQSGHTGRYGRYYQRVFGLGLVADHIAQIDLQQFLAPNELAELKDSANFATQLIDAQAQDLVALRGQQVIDDFRQVELTRVLSDFYDHQGKCERIKKFPLPRQYATMSRVFVGIFILLLPFSMIPELMKIENWGFWLSIPVTALVGWVYVLMEIVGDYTENPFQGMANDIPMLSMCRTIEIDLRQILREQDLPPAIPSRNGVLM